MVPYFREMDIPSLTSPAADLTISGVKKLSVPTRSFLPSWSKIPQAQPCGMSLTLGRSLKSGTELGSTGMVVSCGRRVMFATQKVAVGGLHRNVLHNVRAREIERATLNRGERCLLVLYVESRLH